MKIYQEKEERFEPIHILVEKKEEAKALVKVYDYYLKNERIGYIHELNGMMSFLREAL